MPTPKATSIDEYLANVPTSHRAGLVQLHAQITRRYPQATQHISYGKPLYKLDGHPLVGFSAHKHHSALFVWSSTVLGTLADVLDGHDHAESTIRFPPDHPLPEHLVQRVLDARADEIKQRWGR